MVVIVCLALWAGWLFRFEGDVGLYYLDRWTGELVSGADSDDLSRIALRAIENEPRMTPSVAPPAAGAFDDLIPKK